jgi:primosomal protein N' (replication factor Y)
MVHRHVSMEFSHVSMAHRNVPVAHRHVSMAHRNVPVAQRHVPVDPWHVPPLAARGARGPDPLFGAIERHPSGSNRQVASKRGTGSRSRTLFPAETDPIARVAVDIPLAHLDRPFDYKVPSKLADAARPGTRVRVRFAGQHLDGFILERATDSEHTGQLAYLERVVSPEAVLTPEIAGLARAVADRYAGTFADVLRLAVPPRHATTESAPHEEHPGKCPARPAAGPWERYDTGPFFLDAVAGGRPARAAWTALPGLAWPQEIAIAAATCASARRGTVIVVPDSRDLARVGDALTATGAAHVTLTADLGPAERYRRWLAALRGDVLIAAGTRAAMFAPVQDLGLVVLWDDGDDLHTDPHAPYPNAREVLALRAHRARSAALIGGFSRTTELTQLVASGWAHPLMPGRATLRAAAPLVRAAASESELDRDPAAVTARLPTLALRTLRTALADGPVLIQVPRRGYLAVVACARCRALARCAACGGPLRLTSQNAVPDCRWCGALAGTWSCPDCGASRVRSVVTGAERTAEELGRAFPGVPVRTSGRPGSGPPDGRDSAGRDSGSTAAGTGGGTMSVLATVPDKPALVIATPGAEPVASYTAGLLLDGWAPLGRPSLRSAEETVRRWLSAAALVRPGCPVLVHADPAHPAVQALIRWDPVGFAERELADRAELGFPPAVRMASAEGLSDAVGSLLAGLDPGWEILGPVPAERFTQATDGALEEEEVRALVRASRAKSAELARALQAAQAARSARKEGGGVRVQLDPAELI